MAKPYYIAVLRTLSEHRVDFIVVGGVGAVLQGAPIMTFDLDVVHSTDWVVWNSRTEAKKFIQHRHESLCGKLSSNPGLNKDEGATRGSRADGGVRPTLGLGPSSAKACHGT
jgi:hypothetical protein